MKSHKRTKLFSVNIAFASLMKKLDPDILLTARKSTRRTLVSKGPKCARRWRTRWSLWLQQLMNHFRAQDWWNLRNLRSCSSWNFRSGRVQPPQLRSQAARARENMATAPKARASNLQRRWIRPRSSDSIMEAEHPRSLTGANLRWAALTLTPPLKTRRATEKLAASTWAATPLKVTNRRLAFTIQSRLQ